MTDRKPKVLLIAYYFPPLGGAGTQRSQKFAKHLPNLNVDLTVLAGKEDGKNRWAPLDQKLCEEIDPSLPVTRVDPYEKSSGGPRLGTLRELLCLNSRFGSQWVKSATPVAIELCKQIKPDVIIASMSPFESTAICQAVNKVLGIPWIADLRDPWALDEWQILPSRWHRTQKQSKMRKSLKGASAIVMNTPQATEKCKKTFPELARTTRFYTITNGYDSADFSTEYETDNKNERFTIVHTGAMHTKLGLVQKRKTKSFKALGRLESGVELISRSHYFLLQAISELRESCPEIYNNIRIICAGSATQEDKNEVSKYGLNETVTFPGYLSHEDSIRLVKKADLLFLPMHSLPTGMRCTIVPGKTYEYMASGSHILAAVPEGDTKDFLEALEGTSICKPNDLDSMKTIINELYGKWTVSKSRQQYDRAKKIKKFERLQLSRQLRTVIDDVIELGKGSTST